MILTLGRPRQEDSGSYGLHSKCKASLGYNETLSKTTVTAIAEKTNKQNRNNNDNNNKTQTPKQNKIKHLGGQ